MDLIEPIREFRTILGTQVGPVGGVDDPALLETLQIRMTRQQETAAKVADFLRDHPKVSRTSSTWASSTPTIPNTTSTSASAWGPER